MKCPNCGQVINFNKTYSDYEITAMMNGKSKNIKDLLKDEYLFKELKDVS